MEILSLLLGLTMIASWIYMAAAQFSSSYKDRGAFGKIATWFAIATFVLFFIGYAATVSK